MLAYGKPLYFVWLGLQYKKFTITALMYKKIRQIKLSDLKILCVRVEQGIAFKEFFVALFAIDYPVLFHVGVFGDFNFLAAMVAGEYFGRAGGKNEQRYHKYNGYDGSFGFHYNSPESLL